MSESATLLLSYYNIQELSDDASDIDNIQSINDILNSVRPITCDNPYDINLKGLIFQLSGKKVRNYDIKRASDLIKESITHFQNAIELRKTQFSVISIPEIYLNLVMQEICCIIQIRKRKPWKKLIRLKVIIIMPLSQKT